MRACGLVQTSCRRVAVGAADRPHECIHNHTATRHTLTRPGVAIKPTWVVKTLVGAVRGGVFIRGGGVSVHRKARRGRITAFCAVDTLAPTERVNVAVMVPAASLGRMVHVALAIGVYVFVVTFQISQQRCAVAFHIVTRIPKVGVLVRVSFAGNTAPGAGPAAKEYDKR